MSLNLSAAFSSKTDDWTTPRRLFRELDYEFHFGLDPCATDENALCEHYYTKQDNGLMRDWIGFGPVFMNPPYGKMIGKWTAKAVDVAARGEVVVCLVPARTDTAWWHDCIIGNPKSDGVTRDVRFLRGRLKFGGSKQSAPFPSAIVVMKPSPS